MTESELKLLKASIDLVIVLETKDGEHLAQILFVFDEGETPDLFYLEVEPGPEGVWVQKGASGHSLLLSEIVSVRRLGAV
ncbi:hypothetical protein [Granulicella arctica]|uniref:DUF4926 domain-containing protein n=1 Tax=Granulicella arctica TaxID=940613 RepID=A0A7Y9TV34_9BACT|nr:hypothetical protein [Granulicella arctica]NYF81373.1 hypothetical protein [Granulicella arctica]